MTAYRCGKKKIRDNGFSLLEVLVAMGVMALVLVTLFQMHGSTIKLAAAGRFNAMIPPAVNQILAVAETDRSAPERMPEPFDSAYEGLSWTCVMEADAFDAPFDIVPAHLQRFKKIVVTVTGSGGTCTVTTWRYVNDTSGD
jgi:prepilin-type N-terminal cleavage/methylation domain-containing protein